MQASREYQAPPPVPIAGIGQYSLSNAYDLQFTDVSSDGQVTAVTGRQDCIGDTVLCSKLQSGFVTTITTPGGSHDYPDKLRLSANGKWAFGGTGVHTVSSVYGYLVNLATGQQTALGLSPSPATVSFQVASSGRSIANDGTAVFSDAEAVVVLQGSQVLRVSTQNQLDPVDAVIDAGAHTIVYSVGGPDSCNCGSQSLQIANPITGASTLLVPDGYSPAITDDGQTVLYLSSSSGVAQAYVIHVDGSGNRGLTHDPLGIACAILSGDGSTAYVVTLGARLLKIAVASGEIEELIPRTPYLDANQVTAPGNLTAFTGEGLSDIARSAAPPLPYTLGDSQVTIQGEPTRILGIQPNSLTVLTPPDVTPTPSPMPEASLQLESSASPFAGPTIPVYILSQAPAFLWQSGRDVLAAHEDWSGVVTEGNPAHPGEIVPAYATGLGATSPAVPYGAPAPAQEPLARLEYGYRCSYSSDTTKEVQVPFEGLAPNLAGIYQIDLLIPRGLPAGDLGIDCEIPSYPSSQFDGFIPVGP